MYINRVSYWLISIVLCLSLSHTAYWTLGFSGAASVGSTEPLANGLFAIQNRGKLNQMYLRVQAGGGRYIDAASVLLLNTGLLGNIEKSPPIAAATTVMVRQIAGPSDVSGSTARWTVGPLLPHEPRYFIGKNADGSASPGSTDWCCGPGVPRV